MSQPHNEAQGNTAAGWEDAYRDKWKWDTVKWGTHCVDCYPSNCPYRVYVRNGRIVREEVAATFTTIEPGVPDLNPTGCQKGAAWSRMLEGKDRVTYPMRRAGERGEGRWTRITWDEALTEIADKMLDAIEKSGGTRTVLRLGTTEGGVQAMALVNSFFIRLGAVVSDFLAEVSDIEPGMYATFGRIGLCSSHDDWFNSELVLIWGNNPGQSNISTFHYITEARYNGTEVVTIAPDYNASVIHSDRFVPIRMGTDAALALGMCRVLIDEGLVDEPFVREQTDLGLLVRTDTARFLRQCDLHEDGSDEIFHLFDTRSRRVVEAPRTLDLGELEPALDGAYEVTLKDGTAVEVVPAFVLLKRRLEAYSPEAAAEICGVHPSTIRDLARKAARKRTRILTGFNMCKSYHGDLMERAMCLVIALTGNWGRKGSGIRGIGGGMFDGAYNLAMKSRAGQQATMDDFRALEDAWQAAKAADPTLTRELFMINLGNESGAQLGAKPPFFFWYHQCGYRELFNRPSYNDPGMKRRFDDYFNEAIERGWWDGFNHPTPDDPHRVLFNIGNNPLRMQRGGMRTLLENLWPTLDLIVTLDFRVSTTALYSDYVLPVAQHYEKTNFPYTVHDSMYLTLSDRAVAPKGESLSDYVIMVKLAGKLSERAAARGIREVIGSNGQPVRLDTFYDALTLNGTLTDDDSTFDEAIRDSAAMGTLPPGTTLETLREKGWIRFTGLGVSPLSLAGASDLRPDETFAPFRWQTEKKEPFPTLTRRAQFYIDHDWFLEAGEELPVHKEPPAMGGNHPFVVTSGHMRSSVNGMHSTDRTMLATTRGTPVAHINDRDAAARGIENGQDIRVFNDEGSMIIQARVTPTVRPGQVIVYTGLESYMHPEWKSLSFLETGMVKYLLLAGGYGHLRYRPLLWQPVPIDRGIRVDYEKV